MATELTLRQLSYFVAAVHEGTMSAAAARLGVSASAVSMGIGELEDVAGTSLLTRTPRQPLQLTPAGEAIHAEAREVLSLVRRIEAALHEGPEDAGGVVRMGMFEPFAPFWVPEISAEVSAMSPALTVRVEEPSIATMIERVANDELDLIMLYDDRLPAEFSKERIIDHTPYIILAGDHRLAGQHAISLGELAGEPMVLLEYRRPSYFELLVRSAGCEPQVVQTTTNIATLRTMVARGHVWSILVGPSPHGGFSVEGRPYVSAQIAESVPPMPIVVAWSDARVLPTRVRRVVDVCHDIVGRHGSLSEAAVRRARLSDR